MMRVFDQFDTVGRDDASQEQSDDGVAIYSLMAIILKTNEGDFTSPPLPTISAASCYISRFVPFTLKKKRGGRGAFCYCGTWKSGRIYRTFLESWWWTPEMRLSEGNHCTSHGCRHQRSLYEQLAAATASVWWAKQLRFHSLPIPLWGESLALNSR